MRPKMALTWTAKPRGRPGLKFLNVSVLHSLSFSVNVCQYLLDLISWLEGKPDTLQYSINHSGSNGIIIHLRRSL